MADIKLKVLHTFVNGTMPELVVGLGISSWNKNVRRQGIVCVSAGICEHVESRVSRKGHYPGLSVHFLKKLGALTGDLISLYFS